MELRNLTNKEKVYAVPYSDTVTLWIRHIPRAELLDLYKQATVIRFTNRQKSEDFDSVKADCLLGRAAIKGWEGITFDGNPAECTGDNIDVLMSTHSKFARFINEMVVDIDFLMQQEQDLEIKN